MTSREPNCVGDGRAWYWISCLLACVGIGLVAPAALILRRGDVQAWVVASTAVALAYLGAIMAWGLYENPGVAFRLAVPEQATPGGCSKCAARYVGIEGAASTGVIVWHDVKCIGGARCETRTEARV